MISQITPTGQPGQAREVDRRFGLAGALEHAARLRPQWKHVPRLHEVPGAAAGRRHLDRAARSAALMPVVIPSRASTDTVNAVSNGDSFLAAIRSSPSSSQRSGVSARQISPRPSLAMKLIASGVANCAAIVRSPSFSRSSSSQTTIILPARISSRASSTVANGLLIERLLDVLGEHVDLQVDGPVGFGRAQRRRSSVSGMREYCARLLVDRGTVDETPSSRSSLFPDVSAAPGWGSERDDPRERVARVLYRRDAVHAPLHEVAAEPVGRPQRQLQVDRAAFRDGAEAARRSDCSSRRR